MRRNFVPLLFLSLVLFACSPVGLSAEPTPGEPAAVPTTPATEIPTDVVIPINTKPVLPPDKLIATVSTPHIEQGPDGAVTALPSYQECGFQWAYQDLPELSASFLQSLQTLQPEAQGNAFAFGENCMLSDGSVGYFSAMETDFNVTLQVNDVTDASELGEWVVKVMQIVDAIPPDQIMGPRPGRVSLEFQSNGQQDMLSFYIDQYHGLSPGLSNAEIYQTLKAQ
jgi:hypothetical protein